MKKIIILSDTHKNQELIQKVFANEQDFTHVIHLGDVYEDLNNNSNITIKVKLHRVPGIFHPGYKEGTVPAILKVDIDNWKFVLAHRIEDLLKIKNTSDIYLYGHTHHWSYECIDNKYFINPGHLKAKEDRGRKASYVVMFIDKEIIDIQFKYIDGKIFKQKKIKKM